PPGDPAAADALPRAAPGALPGAGRLPSRHARPPGADRHRGRAARPQPRALRRRHAEARRRHGRSPAPSGRGAFPQGAPARLLCRQARHDAGPPQRPRQARHRRHGRTPDPPARTHRGQAPARVHAAADPRNPLRPGILGRVAFRPLLPQADRHDAAGIPSRARRLAGALTLYQLWRCRRPGGVVRSRMRRRDTIIKGARAVWRILDPRHWPAPLLAGLRACGCTVAYAAALLLSLVWLSSALATLKSPLLDLGKPPVGDAIIAFSHHLSLSPIGIFMLAHLLVALKLVLGTLLLLGVGEGIHGRLRGSPGSRDILDLALFVSAIGSIVAAFPVLAETN